MIKKILVGAFALSTIVGVANAQDNPSWSGPYIGVSLNDNSLRERWSSDEEFSNNINSGRKSSIAASVFLGTNTVFKDQLLYGFEADLGTGTAKNYSDYVDATGEATFLGHAKLRLGYIAGRFLPYVGLGIAVGGFTHDVYPGDNNDKKEDILFGTSLTAGLEFAASDHVRLRAEYVADEFSTAGMGDDDWGDSFYAKPEINTFKIGVAYNF